MPALSPKRPRYLGIPSILPHFSLIAIQLHSSVLNVRGDERMPVGQAYGGDGLAEKDFPDRPAVGVVFDNAIVLPLRDQHVVAGQYLNASPRGIDVGGQTLQLLAGRVETQEAMQHGHTGDIAV